MKDAGIFWYDVSRELNTFVYILDGNAKIGSSASSVYEAAVLKKGSTLNLGAEKSTRFILLAGKPHAEHVILYSVDRT